MNKNIMSNLGFNEYSKDVDNCLCPLCHERIDMNNFSDLNSIQEYKISGLCQKCQDKIFK